MGRTVRLSLLSLLVLFSVARVSATTYYIASNGADSNNGTSKTTPWQHAPGMTGCTAVCASTTPQPGDNFIVRGGDTWHAFNTPTGLTWAWGWSGSSSSPIYIGVDKTWFSGGAWTRPILDGDNPLSTSFITTCAHDEYMFTFVNLTNVNYVTFDNFEFRGMCFATGGNPTGTYLARTGTHILTENNYFHGWTIVQVTGADTVFMINGSSSIGATATFNEIAYNVIDGSDSSGAPTQPSGWPVHDDAYNFHHNVVRYVSNGFNSPHNIVFAHDNLFEYIIQSWDSASHSGIIEGYGAVANQPQYIYNNLTRNTNAGITFSPTIGTVGYFFNNVFYGIGNSTNCFQVIQNAPSTSTVDYFFNNTVDNPCNFRFSLTSQTFQGTANFQNNHYVGYANFSSTHDTGSAVINDNGNEVFQTEAAANAQGYTSSDNYAPTSATGATVGTGANLTNICNLMPDPEPSTACKSGSTGGVAYDAVNHVVIVPSSPATRPATGAWDVGGYEFSSSGGQLNPPTNLLATVH